MATRFYLNLNATPYLTPAVNAGWNVTTGNLLKMSSPIKDGSTIAATQSANVGAAAVRKVLMKQFVSQPLAAQTFTSQTLTGQIKYSITSVVSRTGEGFVYFRVINIDGSIATEVGTLTTTALTTTSTNRTLISLTFSATITAGQRFCWDVGWNYSTGVNTATNVSSQYGSSNASDLPVDNTTTTANNPWFEIGQTVLFQRPYKFFF